MKKTKKKIEMEIELEKLKAQNLKIQELIATMQMGAAIMNMPFFQKLMATIPLEADSSEHPL